MDLGLFFQFFGIGMIVLFLILLVKNYDTDRLTPEDYIAVFFVGPFAPVSLPFFLIYLGVTYYVDRKTR